ncbi:acyltransferase family protein [Actinacidiphila sp. ITFR-21]|uniref:acyltransferase family protein n=1 Tax=Actinacidiphila sp. ITFR-21 TaxID=3075199 RepID=UPI0028891B43|nr:acyltransferase [Streptomyces sp. ITFR-21]WNI18204.1 acyltransferase [Streptomyces sp. ITFR-21]
MTSTASAPVQQPPKLTSITGLRFVAAFAVFLFHLGLMQLFSDHWLTGSYLHAVSKAGWVGVSFFFTLSGFILTWSARADDTPARFWRRRLFKIFPNHVVTYILAMVLFASSATGFGTAVLNLFLLQAWDPSQSVFFSVNNPSWSLGCELLFYLLFPLLHRALQRVRPNLLWWAAGVLVAAVMVLPAIADALLPYGPVFVAGDRPMSSYVFWLVYVMPVTRLLDFVLGILLARIVLTGRWPNIPLTPLLVLFAGAYYLALHLPSAYGLVAATVIPLSLIIPAAASLDTLNKRTFLRNRVWQWLGEISFAFYLLQWPVLYYGRKLVGMTHQVSTPAGIGIMVLWLAISLVLASLLYAFVERPVMRRWSVSPRYRAQREKVADPTDEVLTGREVAAGSES